MSEEPSTRPRLRGRVAVVTGSGRGIGRAEALALSDHGAEVVVNDIGRDGAAWTAEIVVDEIQRRGGNAVACLESVATWGGARAVIDTAVAEFGRLDILVNNAGLRAPNAIEDFSDEEWDRVLESHLRATFATMRRAVPLFAGQRSGVIINTGSESGLGHPFNGAYAAAKEGIAGLTRTAARELARFNVRCNLIRPRALSPGGVEALGMFERWRTVPIDTSPGTRTYRGIPDEATVGQFVTWLCSDAAADVNGKSFLVSGSEIGVYSEPEVVRSVFREQGWDIESLESFGADALFSA